MARRERGIGSVGCNRTTLSITSYSRETSYIHSTSFVLSSVQYYGTLRSYLDLTGSSTLLRLQTVVPYGTNVSLSDLTVFYHYSSVVPNDLTETTYKCQRSSAGPENGTPSVPRQCFDPLAPSAEGILQ